MALAEHLRQLVQKADLHPGGKALLNITISVGVASLAMNEVKSWEQLMNMADIALYRAKSQGRNRVESFNVVSGNSVGHIMFK
ncbi:Diguanylate cyclase DosC [Serratia proteamaculans]|nr:Diguanylate cyclase DosC [Serratia proteamaculans]